MRPVVSRFGTGALVVAALAVGQVLNERLPDGKDSSRLFETPVAIGETVAIRTGDLTPRSVEGAKAVLRSSSQSFRAGGLGVVLRFDFVPRGEASSLSYALFRGGDGTEASFSASSQRSRVSCPGVPPGLVARCTAVLDVDPDALVGSTLLIAPDALDPRFDEGALVDLGIDDADVERWKATEQIEVVETEVDGL